MVEKTLLRSTKESKQNNSTCTKKGTKIQVRVLSEVRDAEVLPGAQKTKQKCELQLKWGTNWRP